MILVYLQNVLSYLRILIKLDYIIDVMWIKNVWLNDKLTTINIEVLTRVLIQAFKAETFVLITIQNLFLVFDKFKQMCFSSIILKIHILNYFKIEQNFKTSDQYKSCGLKRLNSCFFQNVSMYSGYPNILFSFILIRIMGSSSKLP